MNKPHILQTCAPDCDHWQYDRVQMHDESSREGSGDGDDY